MFLPGKNDVFFHDSLMNRKQQHLFEIYIFCNIMDTINYHVDQ